MTANYVELAKICAALTEGETDPVALMATLACELYYADDRFSWTGFYRLIAPETLKIGPYQGGHGWMTIPFERGVCGACARDEATKIVADVETFPGHIAGSGPTRSELALPVWNGKGKFIGVLDIGSEQRGAFTLDDAVELADILQVAFGQVKK